MDSEVFGQMLDAALAPFTQSQPSPPGYIPYDQIVSGAAFLSDDMRKRYADLLRERGMDMMMAYPGTQMNLMGYYNPSDEPVSDYRNELKQFGYDVREIPPDAVNLIGAGIGYPYVAGHELLHYASNEAKKELPNFRGLSESEVEYMTAANAPTKEAFLESIKHLYPDLDTENISDKDLMKYVRRMHLMGNTRFGTYIPPIMQNPDSYVETRLHQNPFKRMYRGIFGIEQPEEKLRDM